MSEQDDYLDLYDYRESGGEGTQKGRPPGIERYGLVAPEGANLLFQDQVVKETPFEEGFEEWRKVNPLSKDERTDSEKEIDRMAIIEGVQKKLYDNGTSLDEIRRVTHSDILFLLG